MKITKRSADPATRSSGSSRSKAATTRCESVAWNSRVSSPSTQSAVPPASPRIVTGADVPTVPGTDAAVDRKTLRKASRTCGVTRCSSAPLRNRPSRSAPPRTSTALGPWAVTAIRLTGHSTGTAPRSRSRSRPPDSTT
ncbi:hypothetical protein [Herbidospora cretacea]|uniref:hypothetical protein n=1 Tax=Herbidospora cretacea TaxID=28444 RepID=UPI000773F003|nr:hypothetical protein [Herbidospora cretacea]